LHVLCWLPQMYP